MNLQNIKDGNPQIVTNETSTHAVTTLEDEPPTAEDIQLWLVAKVAEMVAVDPDEIDITEPFSRFGLDSIAAAGLSGDLEDWLNRRLPPTLVWDYPTIELLAQHLAADSD